MDLNAQQPATGVLVNADHGDFKLYTVMCTCMDLACSHQISVETSDVGVEVNIDTVEKTDFWSNSINPRYDIDNYIFQEFDWLWKGVYNSFMRKVKLTWNIWINGYAEYHSTIILDKQTAANYASTLTTAISDVEKFQKSKI